MRINSRACSHAVLCRKIVVYVIFNLHRIGAVLPLNLQVEDEHEREGHFRCKFSLILFHSRGFISIYSKFSAAHKLGRY